MIKHYNAAVSGKQDKDELIKQIYNIDKVLAEYGCGPEYRPAVDKVVEMFIAARKGDFSLYEQFIESL